MKDSATRTAEVLGGRKEGGGQGRSREEFAELEQQEWREVREAGQQEREQSPQHLPRHPPTPAGWPWAQDEGESSVQPGPRQGSHLTGARQEPPAEATATFCFHILKCRHLGDLERNPNPSHTQANEEKVVGDLAQLVCAQEQS